MKSDNRQYCSLTLRRRIGDILSDPSVHCLVKNMVRWGLTKDCVDAADDARQAYLILLAVADEISHVQP